MVKTFKKSTAFISAAVMFMTMLLYFPRGIFSNIQWRLSASAATVELSEPKGSGSPLNPYQIGTAEELYWFAACVNGTDGVSQNRNACAILTENITVNEKLSNADEITDDDTSYVNTWTPIGNISYAYRGTFDGQNHTISGLYFNDLSTTTGNYVGLFGYSSGTIKNVGVVDSDFNGYEYVGGVCGKNSGTITNCYNTGSVFGSKQVGGVCGYNSGGTITDCHNEGTVEGLSDVGGVCGWNEAGTITDCYNTGSVSGSVSVGGVCGYNCGGMGTATIANCDNTGTVTATGSPAYVGGVCGYNYAINGTATIANCDNTGTVTATGSNAYVGGVCGYNYALRMTATIKNCNNKGNVSGSGNVGGVCGYNSSDRGGTATIANCICTETVSGSGNIGCFCGYNSGTIENCTAIIATIQITELTLTAENLTINAGGITGMNEKGIIRNSKSENLTLNLPTKLSSTESGRLKANLGGVSGNNDAGVISNCTNNTLELSVPDDLKNLSVIAGGLCGLNTNSGKLSSCSNSGEFKLEKLSSIAPTNVNTNTVMYLSSAPTYLSEEDTNEFVIGGVVGTNENSTVENSYNESNVSTEFGNAKVGGVTGQNISNGTTKSCYSTGSVSAGADSVTGGVCGTNDENSIVASCYYDNTKSTTGVGSGSGSDSITGIPTANFSNSTFCENIGYHSPQASNGFKCINCKEYEPANKNSNGTYEISNASQLYWFAGLVSGDSSVCDYNEGTNPNGTKQNKAANAVLTDNITVNSNVLINGALNTTESTNFTSWTPIGNSSNQYTGTFDGKGFTVSGLYFNDTSQNTGRWVGLFGYVGSGGKVSNVGVVDSYFNGNSFVGGVCGINSGTIENCYNTGNVEALSSVGGVCGKNLAYHSTATITNCYNTGNVTATDTGTHVGGVCGDNAAFSSTATITNCYSTGNVTATNIGTHFIGGVCGQNYVNVGTATIANCYSTGNVTADGSNAYVGGVCGYNQSVSGTATIENCYYNSTVYSGNAIGINEGGTFGTDVLGKPTEEFTDGTVCGLVGFHHYQDGFCVTCGKSEACQHVAGYAKKINVIPSTCAVKGSYTLQTYCGICNELMSEKRYLTPLAAHTYGDFYDCSDNSHAKECTVCGDKITGAHTFINGSCRDCGAETPDEYTVSIYFDGTLSSTKVYKSGTVASVSAPVIDGKVFSHWSDTPEGTRKLGTRELFRFYVSADRDIYAIYADTEVKPEPVVYSSNAYSFVSGVKNYVRFEFTRDIPSDYEVVGHGIIYGNSTSVFGKGDEDSLMRFTDSDYSVLPTKVKYMEFTGTSGTGMDYLNVSVGTSTDAVVYARGYAVVKDKSTGTTTVVYSDVKNGSFNSLG